MNNSEKEFMKPKERWLELWQGLIYCRCNYENGDYYAATPIADLLDIVNIKEEVKFDFNDENGAIIIQFLESDAEQEKIIFNYDIKFVETSMEISQNPEQFSDIFGHISEEHIDDCHALVSSIGYFLDRLKREFQNAINSGQCAVFARKGSPIEDFSEVPLDVFRRYSIRNWGHGLIGGGEAEIKGGPALYSIFIEDRSDDKIIRTGVAGRPTSFQCIETYFDHRLKNNLCEKKIKLEAQHLCEVLEKRYPDVPKMKVKSVENKIREKYNKYNRRSS